MAEIKVLPVSKLSGSFTMRWVLIERSKANTKGGRQWIGTTYLLLRMSGTSYLYNQTRRRGIYC